VRTPLGDAGREVKGLIATRPSDDTSRMKLAHRLNTVCPYFTMFPLAFPLGLLRDARRGQWVLDPFCGRGTTMFAARQLGLGSVGIDANPVAVAIARAKVAAVGPEDVTALAHQLLTAKYQPRDVPAGTFWRYIYHPETLQELCSLREQLLEHKDDRAADVLRAVTLGILHGPLTKSVPTYLSNQMPRTYSTKPDAAVKFWKARGMRPPRVPVLDAILRRISYTLALVPPIPVQGEVRQGDARLVLPKLRRKFDWVVTSPPYFGMYTYASDQWLRSWFLGGRPAVGYDASQQISQGGIAGFTAGLATVWKWTAARCHAGAVMGVRFGALPSARVDPEQLLRKSLDQADAGWKIREVHDAGMPKSQARQAAQFKRAGEYAPEIDCIAILSEPRSRPGLVTGPSPGTPSGVCTTLRPAPSTELIAHGRAGHRAGLVMPPSP
jgi:DNA methylase